MNKVYQHGGELFVTLDSTRRMRNLRTGLTIRPRVPFKYLGEMPQVGQVWVGKRTEGLKKVQGFAKGCVQITFEWSGREHYGEVPLEVFLQNHTFRTEPTFRFATGNKDAIKAEHQDRRFILREYQVGAEASIRLSEYCTADVEAEAKMRGSVGLYMSPIGDVFRVVAATLGRVILTAESDTGSQYVVQENHFREFYKALPLPGQLWAKGSRYVTVDRVEDGRVHYTGGSSGLRRFLNEYAKVAPLVRKDVAKMFVSGFNFPEFGTTFISPPRPFFLPLCKPCHDYKFGKQGFKVFGQKFGRMLRPAPTTENTPCPLNTNTLNRLNAGNALDNWVQYRNTLGEKIRYANQRIKELSK